MRYRTRQRLFRSLRWALPMLLSLVASASATPGRNCPDGPTVTENGKTVAPTERQRRLWCEGLTASDNEDYKLAYELMLPFAKGGDPAAKYVIGRLLSRDIPMQRQGVTVQAEQELRHKLRNVPVDTALGLRMMRAAAAKGHPGAQSFLAGLHMIGAGVPRDNGKALRLARQAALKGHHYAFQQLSLLYHEQKEFARFYKWQYLFFNCHPMRTEGQDMWRNLKRYVFSREPGYRDAIADGEKLLKQWRADNGGRLCINDAPR